MFTVLNVIRKVGAFKILKDRSLCTYHDNRTCNCPWRRWR